MVFAIRYLYEAIYNADIDLTEPILNSFYFLIGAILNDSRAEICPELQEVIDLIPKEDLKYKELFQQHILSYHKS